MKIHNFWDWSLPSYFGPRLLILTARVHLVTSCMVMVSSGSLTSIISLICYCLHIKHEKLCSV
uniref:Uncharacterized protein n=1 Tax=Arion vulgaris TaxID=1028688 RepID=A0A0B7B0H1_9EUPU